MCGKRMQWVHEGGGCGRAGPRCQQEARHWRAGAGEWHASLGHGQGYSGCWLRAGCSAAGGKREHHLGGPPQHSPALTQRHAHPAHLCLCINIYMLITSHSVAGKSLTDFEQSLWLSSYTYIAVPSKTEPTCENHLYLFLPPS